MRLDATWRVIEADVLEGLLSLAPASVQTVVTSPPYWGLRDYGTAAWDGGDPDHEHVGTVARTVAGGSGKQDSNKGSISVRSGDCACGAVRSDSQLGLERTPEEYVEHMVAVFDEIWRVLRDDGTVWLNLGDCYAGSAMGAGGPKESSTLVGTHPVDRPSTRFDGGPRITPGLKPKDLVGIPWRVAFALQAAGWYLRSDIVWAKPNPMPESVTDRPTRAHEFVFLLTKSARYYFDSDAVREPAKDWSTGGPGTGIAPTLHYHPDNGGNEGLAKLAQRYKEIGRPERDLPDGRMADRGGTPLPSLKEGRNIRSVWNIPSSPYAGAHFATFPPKLVEPCVKAGSSEKGACPICGAPWRRVVELVGGQTTGRTAAMLEENTANGILRASYHGGPLRDLIAERRTVRWEPGCDHGEEPVPCVVLDPFAGADTTGVVALRHGRSFVGVELSPAYAEMARERIRNDGPLFNMAAEMSE